MSKWISLLLAGFAGASACAETLMVNVTTEGPREGVIAILVFDQKKGFPSKHEKAFIKYRFPVTAEGVISCAATNLPHGTYAISVLHDINDNYKSDKLLGFGPPKEPVGVSNVDKPMRKNPKFEDVTFTFDAENTEIAIPAFYVLK